MPENYENGSRTYYGAAACLFSRFEMLAGGKGKLKAIAFMLMR